MTLPDTSSLDTYGGELSDYRPITDPTTDRPAEGANKAFADVAAMTITAPRAYVQIVGHATTPTLADHWALWGEAPSVAPTLSRTGAGVIEVAWPSTITDDLGGTHTLQVRAGHGQPRSAGRAWVEPHGSTTYKAIVHLLDAAGAANDLATIVIDVWIY